MDLITKINKEVVYDPDTGRMWHNGAEIKGKYRKCLWIGGVKFSGARVAWAIYYGIMPPAGKVIHHANGDATDDRILNLVLLSYGCHNYTKKLRKNNKTGITGVWIAHGKLVVGLTKNGIKYTGGYHNNIEDAVLARLKLEEKHGVMDCSGPSCALRHAAKWGLI